MQKQCRIFKTLTASERFLKSQRLLAVFKSSVQTQLPHASHKESQVSQTGSMSTAGPAKDATEWKFREKCDFLLTHLRQMHQIASTCIVKASGMSKVLTGKHTYRMVESHSSSLGKLSTMCCWLPFNTKRNSIKSRIATENLICMLLSQPVRLLSLINRGQC